MHTVQVDPRLIRLIHSSEARCEQLGWYRSAWEATVAARSLATKSTWLAGRIAIAECNERRGGYHLLVGGDQAIYARHEQMSLEGAKWAE